MATFRLSDKEQESRAATKNRCNRQQQIVRGPDPSRIENNVCGLFADSADITGYGMVATPARAYVERNTVTHTTTNTSTDKFM
eukprot:gene9860-2051_t